MAGGVRIHSTNVLEGKATLVSEKGRGLALVTASNMSLHRGHQEIPAPAAIISGRCRGHKAVPGVCKIGSKILLNDGTRGLDRTGPRGAEGGRSAVSGAQQWENPW